MLPGPSPRARCMAASAKRISSARPTEWLGELGDPGADRDHADRGGQRARVDAGAQPREHLAGGVGVAAAQREHELVAADAATDVARAEVGREASATVTSRASPCAWPFASLTSRKSSMSTATTETGLLSRRARRSSVSRAVLEGAVVEDAGERVAQGQRSRGGGGSPRARRPCRTAARGAPAQPTTKPIASAIVAAAVTLDQPNIRTSRRRAGRDGPARRAMAALGNLSRARARDAAIRFTGAASAPGRARAP